MTTELPPFKEDDVLARFQDYSYHIGDKVISLAEDVVLTCNNWIDPKQNVHELEAAMSNTRKKHLIFYDMWYDEVVQEILAVLQCWPNRYWVTIEFRGCQERHINDVLRCVLEMDVVQAIAFSLTNERFDPRQRRSTTTTTTTSSTSTTNLTTFDLISNTVQLHNNHRLECIIFHQRPFHIIQYESIKDLRVKYLHFLDSTVLLQDEIPELSRGLASNTSLQSFSFLGDVTQMSTTSPTTTTTTNCPPNNTITELVQSLTSHPSLQRLSLNLKSTRDEDGVKGVDSLITSSSSSSKSPSSSSSAPLQFLTLTGGFPFHTFFPRRTFSTSIKFTPIQHLQLHDIFLFDHDVHDLAVGLQSNRSIESLSLTLKSNYPIDVSRIGRAVQVNTNLKRLELAGDCSIGNGIDGIVNLLSAPGCQLEYLHLSGSLKNDVQKSSVFLQKLVDGLRGNKYLRSLDLSCNGLSDDDSSAIYSILYTCPQLSNLDLGMNEVTSVSIESFAQHQQETNLAVLRLSSPKFSFFQIDDKLCNDLVSLLRQNPKLGDINFNMGHIEWHQSYSVEDEKVRWHHFFPKNRIYSLHSKNKRVEYLKMKELSDKGRRDLTTLQYLLDYNWAGRSLSTGRSKSLPPSVWPKVLERAARGRVCFWTGCQEASENLVYKHDVIYLLLRGNLCSSLTTDTLKSQGFAKRSRDDDVGANLSRRKRKAG